MMKRHAMLLSVTLLALQYPVASTCRAGEEIAWGEPANGLRIGINCARPVISSTEQPEFTVRIQNVTDRPLTIPASDAFMPKSHERHAGYFRRPLWPIIKARKATYRSYGGLLRGSVAHQLYGGQELASVGRELKVLDPGESLVIPAVLLEEHSYVEGHDDYRGMTTYLKGKTTLKRLLLFPGISYLISFGFENESAEVEGRKVWTGNAVSAGISIKFQKPSAAGYRIDGKFSLAKPDYFIGEPIYVEFEVVNRGDQPIYFSTGGDYRATSRHDRFSFSVVATDGEEAPDPVQRGGLGGGLGSKPSVAPGGTYSETLFLDEYRAFPKAGVYTVTGRRTLNLFPDGSHGWREACVPAFVVETKMSLTLREDPAALQGYLRQVEERAAGREERRVRQELRALSLWRLRPALAVLRKMALGPTPYRHRAVGWLSRYERADIEETLVKVAQCEDPDARRLALRVVAKWGEPKHHGLIREALQSEDKEERRSAVLLCSREAPEGCFELLMTMGNDEDSIVTRYLCAALAAYGDQKAVPVLLGLLEDPGHSTKIWAASGLGKLGRKDGIPVMIDLLRHEAIRSDWFNIRVVLTELTGKQYREDHAEWRDWWEGEGKALQAGHSASPESAVDPAGP